MESFNLIKLYSVHVFHFILAQHLDNRLHDPIGFFMVYLLK